MIGVNPTNIPFLNENQWLILPLIGWSLFWKGWALWRAARRNDRYWYLGILFLNTLGLLEIFYLLYFSKKHLEEEEK